MFRRISEPFEAQQPDSGWHQSVRMHARVLRDWTRRFLGGEEGLDDVMQEVALATVTSASLPSEEEKILPWLKAVARHKVQDHWRKIERQRRLHDEVEASQIPYTATSSTEWLLEVDRLDEVREVLDSLPADARKLLVAKYSEGRSYEEMAESEGITPKALEYRLSKARELMRARLGQNDETI